MNLYIDTKPTLEWVEIKITAFFYQTTCNTIFGEYTITNYDGYQGENSLQYELQLRMEDGNDYLWMTLSDDGEPLEFNTLSEAKAAAQADYERRTAERFRPIGDLLERAAQLVGNPGTGISGSTDFACIEWQKDYANIQSAIDRAKEGK